MNRQNSAGSASDFAFFGNDVAGNRKDYEFDNDRTAVY